ncbi:DUF3142 domain-containing protein [Alterisphingorhabdus coralli]|uniref:DUF3142 domain-containing protein n=1 Tax=Alterisphingorhabdus coralli TaxID=3071408 RepID=A0AA97FAC6_9SPHN|nr:DUF3142 domain-containing protein [Parasphingorhabdus sp. SCSIO 66989]WOE76491.1 DUF3142 domain-containing protein [Parasphingorhabdus sp. SCSIO 66989]
MASALLLLSCEQAPQINVAPQTVEAADHKAFWLWAGVEPQPVLDQAETVYILDSELRRGDTALTQLRPAVPSIHDADIWMVVRVETLAWSEATHQQLQQRLSLWARQNRLIGLQIDFDAATDGLENYARFLADLRQRLPNNLQLSITGLMDWSAQGDPAALAALGESVDDIVIQTYQGRETIDGYENYLARLARLDMPYRIGLVQNGEWREPADLRDDPFFQGYVVFLVNPEP